MNPLAERSSSRPDLPRVATRCHPPSTAQKGSSLNGIAADSPNQLRGAVRPIPTTADEPAAAPAGAPS
jgi:hypothetical protein